MQFDIFGDSEPVTAAPATEPKDECVPLPPSQLDEWTRTTQRLYLLYLVGAIVRGTYRESSEANASYVLMKLNGLGGEW